LTQDDELNRLLGEMRPRLHRYCARMTGSAIDGDDVVQDVFVKAIDARSTSGPIDNPEGWLFRIAHNAALDFLRSRARIKTTQLDDEAEISAASQAETPDADLVAASFRMFLQLPVLQRCAVILKDVLGHSVDEIAATADCTVPAAKSALQRGRANLKMLSTNQDDVRLPVLSDDERVRLLKFVEMFRAGNFDSVREMLADDVKLDLVARLKIQGREKIGQYFTRYAEARHWRFAAGWVDGVGRGEPGTVRTRKSCQDRAIDCRARVFSRDVRKMSMRTAEHGLIMRTAPCRCAGSGHRIVAYLLRGIDQPNQV
jgi:RNA polymerase sigma-70 factor (ECF subfamily)